MPRTFHRREFVKRSAIACATAHGLGSMTSRAAATAVRVRRNIAELDPDGPEVRALKAGVSAMKDRSNRNPNDVLGWQGQARIHLNSCPHGNWFFLPWHRAYLYFFEQICRAASNDSNFVLPYWDWTSQPTLPDVFWGDQTNPLFDSTRVIRPGQALDPEFVGVAVIQGIMDNDDFVSAIGSDPAPAPRPLRLGQSRLENQPHNDVHNEINGDMATLMSPLDPIFWLHHANVDRLWTQWDYLHPGAFPQDQNYLNFRMNSFVDTNGNPSGLTVDQVRDTIPLGYQYQGQQPRRPIFAVATGVADPPPVFRAAAVPAAAATATSPLQVELTPPRPLQGLLGSMGRIAQPAFAVANSAPIAREAETIRIKITGIEKDLPPGAFVRVFLNCDYLTQNTPTADRHYVSSFSFFGHPDETMHGSREGHGAGGATFYIDATKTVRELNLIEQFDPARLTVGLVVRTRRGATLSNDVLQVKPAQISVEVA